jgi:hypothetical protein
METTLVFDAILFFFIYIFLILKGKETYLMFNGLGGFVSSD